MLRLPALGDVLHWEGFRFSDGDVQNKFFVVIGAKSGCDYLIVVSTSQRHRKTFAPGCNAEQGYYHIPGGEKDFFKKDTWLLLMQCQQQKPAVTRELIESGTLKIRGSLRPAVIKAIQDCLRSCEDAPEIHIALL